MSSISGRSAHAVADLDDDEPIGIRPRSGAVDAHNDGALRHAQLELDAVKEQCRVLQEQVRVAEANKPRKSTKASVPDALNAFDTEIQTLAKKFGVLTEMFPPSKDILGRPLTPGVSIASPASLEIIGKARYASSLAEEAAIVAELDSMLPPHIQNLRTSHHFADLLATHVSTGRSSELHKLRQVATDLFQLPSNYFSCDTAARRLEFPEIRGLLGIPQNATKPKYPTFPPLLYANHKVNIRTPFSNWELLASILRVVFWGRTALTHDATRRPGGKSNGTIWGATSCTPGSLAWAAVMAVFIVSPDSQFPKDGIGANSEIPYHKLFSEYKRLFVNNWDTPYVLDLLRKVNQRVFGKTKAHASGTATMNEEDFTADIDAAMAAMAMALPEHDSEANSEPVFDLSLGLSVGAISFSDAADNGQTSGEVISSNDVAGNEQALAAPPQVLNPQAGEADLEQALDNPVESVSARGRGKGRGSKRGKRPEAAANGAVTRARRGPAK